MTNWDLMLPRKNGTSSGERCVADEPQNLASPSTITPNSLSEPAKQRGRERLQKVPWMTPSFRND